VGAGGAQGSQGRQGATGVQGFQGAQGFQGSLGATGPQGFQGAQGRQGFQGTQGFQGSAGPALTQVFYVDAANVGAADGSIARPFASPTAAFAGTAAGLDVTLLIAPGVYNSVALTIGGARNITMVGLCQPTDQSVTIGAINLAFTLFNATLTLQNIAGTSIADTSATNSNISLIDTHLTGNITGSGTGTTNTIVRMSSVVPTARATGMAVDGAISSVTQVFGEYAIIANFSGSHATSETFPNTFDNCTFTNSPTTGPLLCNECAFPAGLAGLIGTTTVNRLTNCSIDAGFTSVGAQTLYLTDCRVGAGAPTTTITIGWTGTVSVRNTIFPMTSGHIALAGASLALQLDAASERSLFSSGSGNGQATIAFAVPGFQALDQGESNALQIDDAAATYTFNSGDRLVLAATKLTIDRTIQLSLTGAAALDILPLDVYGTNGHTLTVQFASVTIKAIASTDVPARYLFQASEDNTIIVYVGAENFQ